MNEMKQIGKVIRKTITMKYVDELLGNRPKERNATNRHVMALAKSIKNAGWMNSSVISISNKGELVDGQNRLLAMRSIGAEGYTVEVCVYDEKDLTPEVRASFNKSRPQSVADSMKMCYAWEGAHSKVAFYSALARIVSSSSGNGRDIPCDDLLMLCIDESIPKGFEGVNTRDHNKRKLQAFIRAAIGIGCIVNIDRCGDMLSDIVDMRFESNPWARRIWDLIQSETILSGTSTNMKGHGLKMWTVKRIIYACSKWLDRKPCGVLANLDDHKVDEVAMPLIEMVKSKVNFK